MSAYICVAAQAPNGMFRVGYVYPVIEHHGLLLGLADDRGHVRYINPRDKSFIVRNEGNWIVAYPRHAYFKPAPTLD